MELELIPKQASTIAERVDQLFYFLTGLTVVFAGGIFLAVFWFAIKYRRGSKASRATPPVDRLLLEIAWTAVPLVIVIFVFFWSAKVYVEAATPPQNALEIYGVGRQWMWKFQHPAGTREINELHVPVGHPMKVVLASEDVIHSFFVPAFRVKMDVVPGRYTTVWFEATEPGTYHLFCTEYCGTGHSQMIGKVVAMDPADYQAWLEGGPNEGTLSERGAELFQQLGCQSCHQEQAGARGPTIKGLFNSTVQLADGGTVVADEAYIRESILRPMAKVVHGYKPVMPTYEGQISEEGIAQIIAYIKSTQGGGERR
jgi:cytochrome c oxidase subunit II